MRRIVALIGKTEAGKFIDPVSGIELSCIAEGDQVGNLLEVRKALRGIGIVKKGKGEIRLRELRTIQFDLKPALKFRV